MKELAGRIKSHFHDDKEKFKELLSRAKKKDDDLLTENEFSDLLHEFFEESLEQHCLVNLCNQVLDKAYIHHVDPADP